MIYAPVTTPAQLLAALPDFLENEEEAQELLDQLLEETKPQGGRTAENDIHLDTFVEEADTYSSVYAAFSKLYDGSIDEFKRDVCEDYGISTSDFGDYYADWLASNYTVYYIGKKKLIVTP